MLLEDHEVDSRLNSNENLISLLEVRKGVTILPTNPPLKKEGDTTVPPKVRELIGRLGNMGDSSSNISELFGVSSKTVESASKGLIGNRFDADLAIKVKARDEKIESAHEEALDLMVSCITNLKGKLNEVGKPEKLSRIASDMSKIISNLKDNGGDNSVRNTQVIVYAPQVSKESDYETINV